MSKASRLKASGAVLFRFTNSPITRDQGETNLRGRTASSGSQGRQDVTDSPYIFSNWYPWERQSELPVANSRGIYVIAHFTDVPIGRANPFQIEVAYIGETHGKTMSIRKPLNLFNKAARVGNGVHKHSGGNRYHHQLGGSLVGVYVAAHTPDVPDPLLIGTMTCPLELVS